MVEQILGNQKKTLLSLEQCQLGRETVSAEACRERSGKIEVCHNLSFNLIGMSYRKFFTNTQQHCVKWKMAAARFGDRFNFRPSVGINTTVCCIPLCVCVCVCVRARAQVCKCACSPCHSTHMCDIKSQELAHSCPLVGPGKDRR